MIKLIYLFAAIRLTLCDYWIDRDSFLRKEELKMLGSSIILTAKEETANQILMAHKIQEYDSFEFNPKHHFNQARERIEASGVFNIIKKMPKGAALYSYEFATAPQDYFFNLTYHPNVHGCHINNELHLKLLDPATQDTSCTWTSLSELRLKNASFDEHIKSQFFIREPCELEQSERLLKKYEQFLGCTSVLQEQFYRSLLELYNDNVRYYEFRTHLGGVYDLSGRVYDPVDVVALYNETVSRFKTNYPSFIGARLIYTGSMTAESQTLLARMNQMYPDFVTGFELNGNGDLGKPLQQYIDFAQQAPLPLKRFFNAAKSSNGQNETGLGIIDSILLNSSRIAHGFGLANHPIVLKSLKKRRIAVEVTPISNQVVMGLDGLRDHPAAFSFIPWGYPVVVGNDKPAFWGATGMSYDFYLVFMGMTGRNGDLKILKQLALNSLEYSGLSAAEKLQAIDLWRRDWETFLDLIIMEQGGVKRHLEEL